MALFDFFKKSKKGLAPKKSEDKARKDDEAKQKIIRKREETQKPLALRQSRTAWSILRSPHITEKSTSLTAMNQYTFKALGNPAKPEIKKSIEEVYGVHVEKVRKIILPGKIRKRGRRTGWKPGYTKAIVELRKGEKIEVLPH